MVVMYGAGLFPEHTRRIEPAADAWRRFLDEMDRCRIWSWEPDYYLSAVDGTNWRVHLEAAGKHVKSEGSNAYPGLHGPEPEPTLEFRGLLTALRELLDGLEYDPLAQYLRRCDVQ
ncbi:MAG: hypothetical protein K6U03_00515 [Firmicutes bacterium]|nr:hypothetical protein [Bacillota bacterium]